MVLLQGPTGWRFLMSEVPLCIHSVARNMKSLHPSSDGGWITQNYVENNEEEGEILLDSESDPGKT